MQSTPSATGTQVTNAGKSRHDPDGTQALSRCPTAPSDTTAGESIGIACPSCNGSLSHIWRRPSDRILSFFTPLARYRCASHHCRWEGNLRPPPVRDDRAGDGTRAAQRRRSRRAMPVLFIVHMALVFLATVFVFLIAAYA